LSSPYIHALTSPALWTQCRAARSCGFKKCQPRCLNFNVAKATQSQRTLVTVSDACLHLPHSGLFTSPSLFKWQCPFNSRVIIRSWFLE
jgi:hypothetical protein